MSAVVAVRTDRGRLHIARRAGRRYEAACHRSVAVRVAVVYEGAERDRAWRYELRCEDCRSLAKRGLPELVRVAGW